MKKMKKWLLFVAFFLAALQGVSSREIPRDEISPNEYPNIHYLKNLEEPNDDINRRLEKSSDLPQNTGKPTGISQLLPNENGMSRGIPVSSQALGESAGFAPLPQNVEEQKEFPGKFPAGNPDRKDLSAPTRTPVEENTSTKNIDYVQDAAVVQHETTVDTKSATNNNDLQPGSVHAANIPASKGDGMHNMFLSEVKDLQFGTVHSGTFATPPHQEDGSMHNRFLTNVKDLQPVSVSSGATDVPANQEDGTMHDKFLPKVNGPIFTESDKKDEFKEIRPINSEELSSDDVLIPPTTTSVRFAQRGRYRVRRKRRSRSEENEEVRRSSKFRLVNFNRKDNCYDELSRASYVILAVTGWLFAGLTIFVMCIKSGWICRKRCGPDTLDDWTCRCKCHTEDIESGQVDLTSDNEKEMSMYEKHNRRPTGYCKVETIDEENISSLHVSSEPITVDFEVEKGSDNKTMEKEKIEKEVLTSHCSLPEPMTVVMEVEEVVKNETIENEKIEEVLTSHCSLPEPMTVVMEVEEVVKNETIVNEKIEEVLTSHCSLPEPMTIVMEVEKEVVEKEYESIIKETTEEQRFESLPPLPPPMPSILLDKKDKKDSTITIKKKVRFQSDMDCDKEKSQRRASEKIRVIRKLSSFIRRPSLLDEIEIAQEVIKDNRGNNKKNHERRKVIKEATANERRGSLLEEIQFAKNVILPSDDDKEQNENAFHRRQLIKYRSANRRTSLLDNVTMAMDVLNGNIETAV